jgi:hypothetical protein
MPVVKDRRSSLRVEVEGRARIHTNRDEFDARCVDLGLDGIAVRSTRAARPGELVTVEAQIAGQRLRIEAKLVRRQRARGEYLLGLSFVDLDLDTQRRIEHMLFERLAGAPQAEFMRAFAAHADRVPPPAVHGGAIEHTVVAGVLQVPVISGHTQIVALDQLPTVDRTVIAPPPARTDVVYAEVPRMPQAPELLGPPEEPNTAPDEETPGVPDDAWLDDEMDTAQFRLLEAAQAREQAAREANEAALEPEAPAAENTVVVTGFATPPQERTSVTDAPEPQPREHTLVTTDAPEPASRERTLVTTDAPDSPLRERTLVTTDAPDSPPRERTLITTNAAERPLAERTIPLLAGEPMPDVPGERTIPFLRDLLPDPAFRNLPALHLAPPERTAIVSARPAAALALRPTFRALLEAAALLRGPDPAQRGRRGPRVIVSIPHRTLRRVASTPWNQQ